MRSNVLVQQKSIHILLIMSILTSFFLIPAPAKAGMLGSFMQAIRPILSIGGRVGGAVLGATMASAFVPPLGMIAGGIVGWIAGGIITDFATGSLTNLAIVAGGAAGAMALGPSLMGAIGGFLLGGFLGKVAMGLIQKADRTYTKGILFQTKGSLPTNGALAPNNSSDASLQAPSPIGRSNTESSSGVAGWSVGPQANQAEANYKQAYQKYTEATKTGVKKLILKAKEEYLKAKIEFQRLIGK